MARLPMFANCCLGFYPPSETGEIGAQCFIKITFSRDDSQVLEVLENGLSFVGKFLITS